MPMAMSFSGPVEFIICRSLPDVAHEVVLGQRCKGCFLVPEKRVPCMAIGRPFVKEGVTSHCQPPPPPPPPPPLLLTPMPISRNAVGGIAPCDSFPSVPFFLFFSRAPLTFSCMRRRKWEHKLATKVNTVMRARFWPMQFLRPCENGK